MNFQGALTTLAGAFPSFYLGCVAVGRADIPWNMIGEMRSKALAEKNSAWGCPSVFNKNACDTYDPQRYGLKR